MRADAEDAKVRLARIEGEKQAEDTRRVSEKRVADQRAASEALKQALARFVTLREMNRGMTMVFSESIWVNPKSTKLAPAAAAKLEADKQRWGVTIAVVDDAGRLLLLERDDGARPQTAEVATLKARSAAITHRPGKVWEETVKQRPGMLNFPDAFPVQGGLPIVHQGEIIGAVGVSGVQSHEDEQVAAAGIAALGL